jgi:hypothetical protein
MPRAHWQVTVHRSRPTKRHSHTLTWNEAMMPRLGELETSRERVCRPERSAASLSLLSRRYRRRGPMAPEQLPRSRRRSRRNSNGKRDASRQQREKRESERQ